jgi:hypothetical protein
MGAVPDPICAFCSKPIRAQSYVMRQHGEVVHVVCYSHALRVRTIESIDRAQVATGRASRLLDEIIERRTRRPVVRTKAPTPRTCPLCRHSATVIDWRPGLPWLTVVGCRCGTYFVHATVLDERLPALGGEECERLSCSIQECRATKHEAWLTTNTGMPDGALVVRTTRT